MQRLNPPKGALRLWPYYHAISYDSFRGTGQHCGSR